MVKVGIGTLGVYVGFGLVLNMTEEFNLFTPHLE